MTASTRDAAQNQHYVPKFILRNFLSDEAKEQVSVFRKSTGKGFVTSIRNVMAERRFHDFTIGDDYLASFEGGISSIEQLLLPTYRRVVADRRLPTDPGERGNLAVLMAFQYVRTRQQREQFARMERQLRDHLAKQGGSIEQLEGYEPLTEDSLKVQHMSLIRNSMVEFANAIAVKDLLLLAAPEGRSFYLADNPVCLHNSEPAHPLFGNIGLAVRGIEVYLPLSADLMLAAWCPSLLEKVRAERTRQNHEQKTGLLAMVMCGDITPDEMRLRLAELDQLGKPIDELLENSDAGTPVPMLETNMDFSNSLQMTYAGDYVICKQGDFRLARRFVGENPGHTGRQMTTM